MIIIVACADTMVGEFLSIHCTIIWLRNEEDHEGLARQRPMKSCFSVRVNCWNERSHESNWNDNWTWKKFFISWWGQLMFSQRKRLNNVANKMFIYVYIISISTLIYALYYSYRAYTYAHIWLLYITYCTLFTCYFTVVTIFANIPIKSFIIFRIKNRF
jgi:hypothetical protein